MAKDPAFLFYPGDWLGGTIGMSFEEKGAYMELLMMQFTRGHMTSHMIGQTVGQLWDKLQDKFIQDDNGLWFNRRLDEEKEKRKNFTGSRKNNLSGKNQYSKKDKKPAGHMTSHMENENVNEIIDNKIKESFDEIYLQQEKMKWPWLDFEFQFKSFCSKVRGSPEVYRDHDSLRLALQKQLRTAPKQKIQKTNYKVQ